MTQQKAYSQIAIFSIIIGLILGGLHYANLLGSYPSFAWFCYLFFTLLSIIMIALTAMGNKTSSSGNAIRVTIGSFIVKFVFSILIILIYYLAVEPSDKKFILPFFVLYILYTVAETAIILKLANTASFKANKNIGE